MTIRKAAFEDMDKILGIYAYAREQMRLSGNPDQWGVHYPPMEIVQKDIENGNSYVITDAEDEIFAVFVFIIGDDPTYKYIENGNWLNDDVYGTIHRVASSGKQKGVLRVCLQYCEAKIQNIRVDTHENNRIMHRG